MPRGVERGAIDGASPECPRLSSGRLCCDFDVIDRGVRFRDGLAGFAHRLKVGGQGVLEVEASFLLAVSDGRAARDIIL